MSREDANVLPDTTLLEKLGHQSGTIPAAMAELIDNSFRSFKSNLAFFEKKGQKSVTITISYKTGKVQEEVTIQDDAYGMSKAELEKSMKLAHTPNRKKGGPIHQFGMGMKWSCSSIGSWISIFTSRPAEKVARELVYDEEEFQKEAERWTLPLNDGLDKPEPGWHGTRISLKRLRKKFHPSTKRSLIENLGITFAYQLERGLLKIIVNDERVQPASFDLQKGSKRNINIDVNGKKVTGWVGLQEEFRQRGNRYGFRLILADRVLKPYQVIGFENHPRYSRIVGELHLDEFEVAFDKSQFFEDDDNWAELNRQISTHPNFLAVKRECTRQAVEGTDDGPTRDVLEKELSRLRSDISSGFSYESADQLRAAKSRKAPSSVLSRPSDVPQKATLADVTFQADDFDPLRSGKPVDVVVRAAALGKSDTYKKVVVEKANGRTRLIVVTNVSHLFYQTLKPRERRWWYLHNLAEAAAEWLMDSGWPKDFTHLKGLLLQAIAAKYLKSGEDDRD